jgi:hypothetical protein
VCTWRATTAGFMNMPDPIIPPITIIVGIEQPEAARKPGS